jgi:hypothetical protein
MDAIDRPRIAQASSRQLAGTCKQFSLVGLSREQVQEALTSAVTPIVGSADGKCSVTWVFYVDGALCAVWDYKGSSAEGCWSAFGPEAALQRVFGAAVWGRHA